MKATVIVNPIAGRGRSRTIGACVDLVKSVFATHHYDADVRVTTGPNDANRFATEAVANQPIARLGRADEIAASLLWLCSPGASFIVGVALPVDGGYTAR